MKEEITFPCGCRTRFVSDSIKFSYCDDHSIEKLHDRIGELETELGREKRKVSAADEERKKLRNEADFEYFKLLEKKRALERKLKNYEDKEDLEAKLLDQNKKCMEKLRKLSVEFIRLKNQVESKLKKAETDAAE